jgi:hypothetical protein
MNEKLLTTLENLAFGNAHRGLERPLVETISEAARELKECYALITKLTTPAKAEDKFYGPSTMDSIRSIVTLGGKVTIHAPDQNPPSLAKRVLSVDVSFSSHEIEKFEATIPLHTIHHAITFLHDVRRAVLDFTSAGGVTPRRYSDAPETPIVKIADTKGTVQ